MIKKTTKLSSCWQRRFLPDAQADLSLHWAHLSEGTFSHVVAHFRFLDNSRQDQRGIPP